MAKKKGNQTISIYFRKGVWEKIKRLKYPGKLVNRLLEKHYGLVEEVILWDDNIKELEKVKDELSEKLDQLILLQKDKQIKNTDNK